MATAAFTLVNTSAASAQDYNADTQFPVNRTTYGDLGIIEMPSARMAPDGQLSVGGSAFAGTQRYTLDYQILPWLEGSFRYSRIEDRRAAIGPDFDRSFGLKLRLWEEGSYVPEVSLGIRDLVGTGIYGEEYLVATKSFWNVDVSGGLGWGRLAGTDTIPNPLGWISNSFDNRSLHHKTGVPGLSQWFHGPDAGIFGGVVWHTPIEHLDLTAEYSSDRYRQESRGLGPFRYRSPFNFGLTYHPFDWVQLSTDWLYGDTFGFTVSLTMDPTQPNVPMHLGPQPIPVTARTSDDQQVAVANFVEAMADGNSAGPDQAWVQVPDQRSVIQRRLAEELASASGTAQDFEVQGRTLLVYRHGSRTTSCKTYAQLAANSGAAIASVAVTDLSSANGSVAICDVPAKTANVAGAHTADRGITLLASNTVDLTAAGNVDATPDQTPAPAMPVDIREIERKIRADATSQSLGIEGIAIGSHEVTVYLSNDTYYFEAEAIGRLSRILMADTPPGVEMFRIVSTIGGLPIRQTQIMRSPMERMYQLYGQPQEVGNAISINPAPMHNPVLDAGQEGTYPRLSWAVFPQLRESVFDPKSPIQFEVAGIVAGSVSLLPGLSLNAAADGSIWNDYDLSRGSNSSLPHVRSDFHEYLRHGINGIGDLSLDYVTRLGPDVYAMGRAGILEDMFAGVGGQVLWRPDGSRWAVGADVYEVWQRGFDRLFEIQKYHVTTGHVSIYYQSPWYDLNLAVHAGRYLAGDYGATFEITRRFDTGVEIGAFATFTNVPFKKFGEGSFDKGIIVHIPLEWLLPFFSGSSYDTALRPLTRDGGQRLAGDDSLYGYTDSTSQKEIAGHIDDIAYPTP